MVSVRCLTYNHAPYIVDAMNGFVMQETSFPVVNLIVDDASTDGEADVIRKFIAENFEAPFREEDTEDYQLICANHNNNPNCSFVVFLLKYNHFQSKKSKFPYLIPWSDRSKYHALCEGDDYWIDPNKIQEQVMFLEEHPSFVMSHTAIRYYFEEDKHFYESKDIAINSRIIREGLTPEKLLLEYRIQLCTVVYRQEAFTKAKQSDPYLFDGSFRMGDTQLWYQLLKEGNIFFYPKVCAIYRKHTGSATKAIKLYDKLQFSLSSVELRLYLAQRDSLSDSFVKYVKRWYNVGFIKCLAFKSNLSARFTVNLKENIVLFVLYKVRLLKPYLHVRMITKSWLSSIKRHLNGEI